VCVNTMPKRKDISNELREAIVAAINFGRVTRPFPKLFEVHHSTARNIITFKPVPNLHSFGRPSKFTPWSDRTMLRETAKNNLRLNRPH